jgi:hypothetical protein
MRAILICCCALTVTFAGCSSKNKGKIEGTKWSSHATTIKGQSLPAGFLKLEFGKDGSLVYQAGPLTFRGKYSLGMGDKVTLKFDKELGNTGSKTHVESVEINGDTLTMKDSDGQGGKFSRVK